MQKPTSNISTALEKTIIIRKKDWMSYNETLCLQPWGEGGVLLGVRGTNPENIETKHATMELSIEEATALRDYLDGLINPL